MKLIVIYDNKVFNTSKSDDTIYLIKQPHHIFKNFSGKKNNDITVYDNSRMPFYLTAFNNDVSIVGIDYLGEQSQKVINYSD